MLPVCYDENMEIFDIDSIDPGYEVPNERASKRNPNTKKMSPRFWNVRLPSSGTWGRGDVSNIGIKPDKMRVWRSLEKRSSELRSKWKEANSRFWTSMRDCAPEACRRFPAWISVGDDVLFQFDGESYSRDSVTSRTKELVDKPGSARDFIFVQGDIARNVGKLSKQEGRWHRAWALYEHAFQRAVSDRIAKHWRASCPRRGTNEPFFLLIKNEDRVRVVHVDYDGKIEFKEGGMKTTLSERT